MSLGTQAVLPSALLDQARSLELWLQSAVRGSTAGRHRAKTLGGGGEFAEYRDYRPGDELRHIDWKAAARSDRLVVRRFESDRRADVHLVVDRSASMSFGTTGGLDAPWGGPWPASKWEMARLLSAALSFVVLRGGDRLGLSIADGAASAPAPLIGGQGSLGILAELLVAAEPQGTGDFEAALSGLSVGPRRNLIVVISDLLQEESVLPLLARHRASGTEVWVVHVVDPAEINFPYDEPTRFVDLETSAESSLNPRDFASTYRAEFQAFLEEQERACREAGVNYRRLRTDAPLDAALMEFLDR